MRRTRRSPRPRWPRYIVGILSALILVGLGALSLASMRTAPPATAAPTPPPRFLGVIEGFYGNRWSVQDTDHVLSFMAQHGLNTFVYAPKNDPYQRVKWNQLYPAHAFRYLQQVVHQAVADHVLFVYSISPGLSIQYGNAADRQALLAKINQVRKLGVQEFMLSFDDIPVSSNPAALAKAQAQLANYVIHQEQPGDPGFRLMFTPTQYYGIAPNPYWTSLRSTLMPSVPVIWTGLWVLNQTITRSQLATVSRELGHPIIIWDNYPVNDYTYVQPPHQPRLLMGPLQGRSPSLPSTAQGYLFNPMLQPIASLVPLWTEAAYLTHPHHYQPQASWYQALQHFGGAGDTSFQQLCSDLEGSPLNHWTSSSRLVSDLTTLAHAGSLTPANTSVLQPLFAEMATAGTTLSSAIPDHELYQEMRPWIAVYQDQGQAGLLALQVLAGHHPNAFSRLQDLIHTLHTDRYRLDSSAPLMSFLQRVVARPAP